MSSGLIVKVGGLKLDRSIRFTESGDSRGTEVRHLTNERKIFVMLHDSIPLPDRGWKE